MNNRRKNYTKLEKQDVYQFEQAFDLGVEYEKDVEAHKDEYQRENSCNDFKDITPKIKQPEDVEKGKI